MKIACISDTHGIFLPEIPEGVDFVLHAGDIGPDKNPSSWLAGPFSQWANALMAREIGVFATWGNHDFIGERMEAHVLQELVPANVHFCVDGCLYIEDSLDEQNEVPNAQILRVWMSPWSPTFGDWAFMKDENALAKIYEKIPTDIDVLVSHSPPRGYGDRTARGEEVGSTALFERFVLTNAKYLVCGHIHEGHGCHELDVTDQVVVNASQVDETYEPREDAVQIIEV